ncbi:hypothetical protein GUITHDRAFT_103373 [Guillardia theta CCMP2712]|uniref:Uncharacterized protein n=2 Tax=Guillardia theta TaxID=55529 RepID=L1JRU0_GUITC|nr:hypothetical protein GUITHDRAFT_103373 [Guillardia theta CCMP2712]EKX50783.1 hypothetical protein GUITHDRAFT_103373 [Guillardia theta CCMP2712]|eukprot:XP_005837763.1 hypothetical protein GUITHDRAFT_103373 [Guillardia theta CCMP2712]
MVRVYLHVEGEEPEFTLPLSLEASDERTVDEFKCVLLKEYNGRFGRSLDPAGFSLATSNQKLLPSSERLFALAKRNLDIFLVPRKAEGAKAKSQPRVKAQEVKAKDRSGNVSSTPPPSAHSSSSPAASSSSPTAAASSPPPLPKVESQKAEPPKKRWTRPVLAEPKLEPQAEEWLRNSLNVAEQLKAKGSLRQACIAWKSILSVCPKLECLEGLGSAELSCKRYDEAIEYFSKAVAIGGPKLSYMRSLGLACHCKGEYMEALTFFTRALEMVKNEQDKEAQEIKVLMGKSLYASGEQEAAIQVYTEILQKHEDNDLALLEYAKAYIDRRRSGEALRILLRVLVHMPNDKETRRLMSEIIKAPGGMSILKTELGEAASSGPALAFIATLIKDYGAVEEAVQLYYSALESSPAMTAYILNLVHTLEVCNRYQEALMISVSFCQEQQAMAIGDHYTNGDVADMLKDIDDLFSPAYKLPLSKDPHPGIFKTVVWIPNHGSVICRKGEEKSLVEKGEGASTALPSPAAPAPEASKQKLPPYSSDELDLLALHFTIVKILYVTGALARIPDLVELIEPARRGWDMHLTNIRNEHAYYCCVAQLMVDIPWPYPSCKGEIFVAGDSHCLSTAWQVLSVHGSSVPLVPKLVTGLKCWHLREESVFFPKNNFYNVMASIPDGASVIFLFGEIDCREGILRAVEKGVYADLDEGIAYTIGVYTSALLQLQSQRKWKVFVQPVAPVLNETREVVKLFNKKLKEEVTALPSFRFLDILDDLLTPDGKFLSPEFEM